MSEEGGKKANKTTASLASFLERLQAFFPNKEEKALEEITSPILADPVYFGNPQALALLFNHKWKISLNQAFFYAQRLAPLIAAEYSVGSPNQTILQGNPSFSSFDLGGLAGEYSRLMLSKEFFREVRGGGGDLGSMDMEKMMGYALMSKLFCGGDSGGQMQNLYVMIKNDIESLNKRIDKMEEGGSKIRFISLPGEDGKLQRYPVYSESDILQNLIMMGKNTNNEDKLFSLTETVVNKLLPEGGHKGIDDKVYEQMDKRVTDLKEFYANKNTGDIEQVTTSIKKLGDFGLKVGTETIDDKMKILEKEVQLMDKKFDLWLKTKEYEDRSGVLKGLVGKVGEGIKTISDKYSDEIKEGLKGFFSESRVQGKDVVGKKGGQ